MPHTGEALSPWGGGLLLGVPPKQCNIEGSDATTDHLALTLHSSALQSGTVAHQNQTSNSRGPPGLYLGYFKKWGLKPSIQISPT